jgi:acylphosphatase
MIHHYKITVRGKVQGVFYRESTKRKAQELNIKGFVRNHPDGSVYIEAEGPEMHLTELVAWCQRGPEMAEVISVTVEKAEPVNHTNFEIRR